jgi:hypothetical protein
MNNEKDPKRGGNAPNPNLENRPDNQHKKHQPLLDKEKNQALNRDPDQHLIPLEDESGDYNSPDGGGERSGNRDKYPRQDDRQFTDHRRPLGSYQENDPHQTNPSKEDLDENVDREENDEDRRNKGSNSANQQDYARREDGQLPDRHRPPGSYQEDDPYGNSPSKEDRDDHYDREESDGDWRNQGNNSRNQQDYARQEDGQVPDNRRPLGSYQEDDQYRKDSSKEDLDENFDQH